MHLSTAKAIAKEFVRTHEDRFVRSKEVIETGFQVYNKYLDKPGVVFSSAEIVEAHLVKLLLELDFKG